MQRRNISQRARALGWTLLDEAGPFSSGETGCGAAHCPRTVPVAIRSLMSSGEEECKGDFGGGDKFFDEGHREALSRKGRGRVRFATAGQAIPTAPWSPEW